MEIRVKYLRVIGISEGISFLVLLLIAMPLKYYFGLPLAVKIAGWVHGILFIAYVAAVCFCIQAMRWNWFSVLVALGAALLPLGTFVLDKELKRRQHELTLGISQRDHK
jgi:integral membrane protein